MRVRTPFSARQSFPKPPTAAPEQKTTLTDIPNENKIPHLPKVSRNTRKSTHLPKVEQQQSPPTPNISLLSTGFRTFAALWQTIISKEDTTSIWSGRQRPRKRNGQPGKSGWTPTGNGWPKNARSADGPCQSFRRASIITSLSVSFRSARIALT